MNSGQPSMPSNPALVTPEQRRRYNEWARQNGEPLWGAPAHAPAAPAAAAAPVTQAGQNAIALAVQQGARARLNPSNFRWQLSVRGGRKYTLTNEDGTHNRFGAQYSLVARRMGLDNYELNLWQDGLRTLDGSNADFAYDVNSDIS